MIFFTMNPNLKYFFLFFLIGGGGGARVSEFFHKESDGTVVKVLVFVR